MATPTRKIAARKAPARGKEAVVAAKKPVPVPARDHDDIVEPAPAAPAKGKRVHGKFAMPKADYALIDELKQLASKNGTPVRKNELLRAGLRALRGMDALALRGAIAGVRPAEASTAKPKAKGKAKA
jgi:hypothetical protein